MNILITGNHPEGLVWAYNFSKKGHSIFAREAFSECLCHYQSDEETTVEATAFSGQSIDLRIVTREVAIEEAQLEEYPGIPTLLCGLLRSPERVIDCPDDVPLLGVYTAVPVVKNEGKILWLPPEQMETGLLTGYLRGEAYDEKAEQKLRSKEIPHTFIPGYSHFLCTQKAISCATAGALATAGFNNHAAAADNYIIRLMVRGLREALNMLVKAGIILNPSYYRIIRFIPGFMLIRQFERVVSSPESEIALADYSQFNREELLGGFDDLLARAERCRYRFRSFSQLEDFLRNPPVPGEVECP